MTSKRSPTNSKASGKAGRVFGAAALGALLLAVPAAAQGRRRPESKRPANPPSGAPSKTEAKSPTPPSGESKYIFWAENADANIYSLFANGGWDGNWFVGYGTAWITKVPPPPKGNYAHAYLGARLGRMKTEPIEGRPSWERKPIVGDIDMAIAEEALWPESRRRLLTRTDRIPLEGEPGDAIEGVGESRWFWVEVPLQFVSFEKDNYIVVFTPSPALKDIKSSPVLAAAPGDKRPNTWLFSNAQGGPPANPEAALKTAVSFFDPALALKLVTESSDSVAVTLFDGKKTVVLEDRAVVRARISGADIQEAWLEFSDGGAPWQPVGPVLSGAPYTFTLKRDWFPTGKCRVRVGAANVWQKTGYSAPLTVQVAPPPAKKNEK